MISEVVSDLLDFLDKKEEFKVYLQEKQQLREAKAKEESETPDDIVKPTSRE